MVVALRVEIALHNILFIVPIVCACPAAWGVGNLHKTAAVEEEPCPSAVGSMSPGAVEFVEEEAFDRFRRLISVEAALYFHLSKMRCRERTGRQIGLNFLHRS